jgi:hypothetical protein
MAAKIQIPWCEARRCPSERVNPWLAASIVAVACTIPLFFPFLVSAGFKPNSNLSWGTDLATMGLVVLIWSACIMLGWIRKHENPAYCFFDSFGLPALISASAGFYTVTGPHFLG